jgi:hypothetical protein
MAECDPLSKIEEKRLTGEARKALEVVPTVGEERAQCAGDS